MVLRGAGSIMGIMNVPFTNLAVFALFFGLALIEALERSNWIAAILFLALGIMSLWADLKKR